MERYETFAASDLEDDQDRDLGKRPYAPRFQDSKEPRVRLNFRTGKLERVQVNPATGGWA